MNDPSPERPLSSTWLRRIAITAAILLAGAGVCGGLFVWFGLYDVAADRQHWQVTDRLLAVVRDRSIAFRAPEGPVPDLSEPGLAELGAQHYRAGCAFCHGTPGEAHNPVAEYMLPRPPDLSRSLSRYDPRELFWIIDHGLKFTGMPGWPAQGRGDEIWAAVALVVRLGTEGPGAYRRLLRSPATDPGADTGGVSAPGCGACHGDAGSAPIDERVPVLAGQSAAYLARALHEFQAGLRPSGIMAVAAASLSASEIDALAARYAALPPPRAGEYVVAGDGDGNAESVTRGRAIARDGLPGKGVPACLACHGDGARAAFPSLDGLSARYLSGQLALWRAGLRTETGHGAIMGAVADRLSPAEAEDAAAFFAARGADASTATGAATGAAP